MKGTSAVKLCNPRMATLTSRVKAGERSNPLLGVTP